MYEMDAGLWDYLIGVTGMSAEGLRRTPVSVVRERVERALRHPIRLVSVGYFGASVASDCAALGGRVRTPARAEEELDELGACLRRILGTPARANMEE